MILLRKSTILVNRIICVIIYVMLTQSRLKELFSYKDGDLVWKVRKANRLKIGDVAGTDTPSGYRVLALDGKIYYAHHLVWMWHNGYMPDEIDHINGIRDDNRIENLRECTRSQNSANAPKRKSYDGKITSSKYKGVYWYKRYQKWKAQIGKDGKMIHLGYFDSERDAAKAYDSKAKELFGEFAAVNF